MDKELKLMELQALHEAPQLGNSAMQSAIEASYFGREKMR